MLLLIVLVLPFVSAFNEQLISPCFGDPQISSPCFTSNQQIFYFGKDFIAPVITLISPEQGTIKDSGVIKFKFNPTDNNPLINCSLVYQGGIFTTITSQIKDQENTIEVVGIDNQHPLYNDDLQWGINCTDQFNNIGASEIRNLDTRTDAKGGITGVKLENPKFINILADEIWIKGENIVKIEAFNQADKLFIPKNITFNITNDKINLTKREIINKTTIVTFNLDENIKNGAYLIIANIIDERTITEDIEFFIGEEVRGVVKDQRSLLKRFGIIILAIGIILIISIIVLMIIIDKRKKRKIKEQ